MLLRLLPVPFVGLLSFELLILAKAGVVPVLVLRQLLGMPWLLPFDLPCNRLLMYFVQVLFYRSLLFLVGIQNILSLLLHLVLVAILLIFLLYCRQEHIGIVFVILLTMPLLSLLQSKEIPLLL